jgi:hypothetical protein
MKRRFLGKAITLMVLLLLLGCGPTPIRNIPSDPNIEDTQNIQDGRGVIVTRIILNERNIGATQPQVVLLAKTESFPGRSPRGFTIKAVPGESIHTLTLPAGTYSWLQIWIQGPSHLFRGGLPFKVEAGKVNYIGDVIITIDGNDPWHYGMRLSSDPSTIKSDMLLNYPKLMARYPLVMNLTEDNR